MSVKISTFQWHEFFPRGRKLEHFGGFLHYYIFFQNGIIIFVLCSSKKSWCCSCTLVSNYSGMCLQVSNLVSVSNFNICHAVIQHVFFLFRYTLWIPRSGMPYSLRYLVVFMGHSVASERSVDCPLLNPFLKGLFWIVLFIYLYTRNLAV